MRADSRGDRPSCLDQRLKLIPAPHGEVVEVSFPLTAEAATLLVERGNEPKLAGSLHLLTEGQVASELRLRRGVELIHDPLNARWLRVGAKQVEQTGVGFLLLRHRHDVTSSLRSVET